MRHPDLKVKSLADLLRALARHKTPNGVVWYRGQSDKKWGLVPSLARKAGINLGKENAIYKRFLQNATQLVDHPPTEEWVGMIVFN